MPQRLQGCAFSDAIGLGALVVRLKEKHGFGPSEGLLSLDLLRGDLIHVSVDLVEQKPKIASGESSEIAHRNVVHLEGHVRFESVEADGVAVVVRFRSLLCRRQRLFL